MSRPFQAFSVVVLIAASVVFSGCHQPIYRSTYSPRRNYYVPPSEPERKEAPTTVTTPPPVAPAPQPVVPGASAPSAPAPAAPGGIPGL